ncbi:TlpA family protein disulfide reductase [Olivibacter sitiensis]|uniref:TlpA family protein disulfide reductase n=1 Tax=Olivibacter sitiensis TaxID=376470 RepID=UPI0004247CC9|nr:TlpA disulfide reductase family protein [Olivibacter sitiensis]
MKVLYLLAFLCPKYTFYKAKIPTLLVWFFTMLCLANGTVFAQSAQLPTNIQQLKIGDAIPEALWHLPLQVVNHPDGKDTITLNDYRGKLVILDFWATWCVPCIRNFAKLHALQNEFGDKVKVLAVTPEDTDKITKFFKTGVGKEHTYVNSVINDRVLTAYFPHKTLPHIVWIDPRGKVLNTTQGEDVSQANVQAILDGQMPRFVAKVDIDRDRPLFISDHFGEGLVLKSYSIFAKGYYPGLPSGGGFKKTQDGKIQGRQVTNLPMMDIYYPVLYDLFGRNGEKFNLKHTIIEVKEPTLLNLIHKPDGTFEKYNLYNYELIVPEDKVDSLYYYMLEDLNRYSDYIGTIEKRMVDCLVLIRTSTKDKIKSKGGKIKNTFPQTPSILSNCPIGYMLIRLNDDTPIELPIIDETGYSGNVDIEISGFTDLASLKKELNRYDLDLIPVKRNLFMFVLTDK